MVLVHAAGAHVERLATMMRDADRAELIATDGRDAQDSLLLGISLSEFSRTVMLDGEPAAMFGVRVLDNGVAVPWLLTTTLLDRAPVSFWRASKAVVREIVAQYPVLIRCVDARHRQALSYAARLGFTIGTEHPCGVAREPFRTISMGVS
jgi:hypothetical protein